MPWLALLVTGGFAAIHLFAARLRFIRTAPRSRYLSLAGGVSVAYVFVHLLPEAEHFAGRMEGTGLERLGPPVYLLALAGVIVFYGMERWVVTRGGGRSEMGRGEDHTGEEPSAGVFWVHVGSFAVYNALICYLLVREAQYDAAELAIYAVAMGLHFLVNDFGLRDHHGRLYDRWGRWLLATAAVLGWAVGWLAPLHPAVTGGLFGFLCGATVLNVLKEELPAERESRFGAFALGAAGFAGLLLLLPGG